MRSPFRDRPGAVEQPDSFDPGVPAHYGGPFAEQRALAEGRAIVDLGGLRVLSVSGADRLRWLDSMSSQNLSRLRPGQSAETLFLDPNGRILHAVRALDDGETTWLLAEQGDAAELEEWLRKMVFTLRVEITDRSEGRHVIAVFPGELADSLVAATGAGVPLIWTDPWPNVQEGGWQYATGTHAGSEYAPLFVLVDDAEYTRLAATAPVAGALALEALRIAAWRPRGAAEVDARTIPHEVDWLRTAVHLTKGCYRGQETVAKVHNLGRPPRRLVLLQIDGSDGRLPDAGAQIVTDDAPDKQIGRVTSSARHYELGPIALALVKRNLAVDAMLVLDPDGMRALASQEVIVPTDAGATADIPRLRRLGVPKTDSKP